MLDMIGAIAGTAAYAALVGALIGLSPVSGRKKLMAFAAAAAWGAMVVAIAAVGGFAPGAAGPIPAPVLAFAALVALLFGSWFVYPRFRSALSMVPLPVLVALNAGRLGGVFFLILSAERRLTGPFGPVAGAGDILVGALAVLLAATADRRIPRGWFRAWNALGALDLVVAISLGALSAPGTPFRVFDDGPGTTVMTSLPWILVPALLVPLYLLIHLTIAFKLRSARRVRAPVAGAERAT